MFFKKIIKVLFFLLLLFVFSCGNNRCAYLGPESKYEGVVAPVTQTSDFLSNVPKFITGQAFNVIFGIPTDDKYKGSIGRRAMIADNKQKENDPGKADLSKDKDRGTIYSMYAGIIRSPEYRATYYLGLTLYIVILGLTYLLGMTELTLQKSIPIFIKIGVISLFTNPTLSGSTGMPIGWSAYYSIIVSPSIYAMEEFAMYFCSALFEMDINNINDGFAPLAIMLSFLFNSSTFWLKMTTILFDLPMGLVTFFFVLASMLVYTISSIISLLGYVTVIVTLGLLFSIGPIFFIFLLFEKTKVYFDKWWKQILALMLQQYTLFIAISVFGFIIMKCATAMLTFNVFCKDIITIKFLPNLGIFPTRNLFSYYAPKYDGTEMLELAMRAIFFLMLTSIYATSIEKISDISSGLIEGASGAGTMLGTVGKGWDTVSSAAVKAVGNAGQNVYRVDQMATTTLNAAQNISQNIKKLDDDQASGWDKAGSVFQATAGTLWGVAKSTVGNTLGTNTQSTYDRGKDVKKSGEGFLKTAKSDSPNEERRKKKMEEDLAKAKKEFADTKGLTKAMEDVQERAEEEKKDASE